MKLGKMIIPSKTAWLPYPGLPGFEVQLAYLTRDELMKMRKKAITLKPNRQRSMEEEVDNELFQSMYFAAVLKDWKGLKFKYLPKLIPTDISGEDPEEVLEYSEEDAEVLMKNATGFDSWVSAMLEDIENFTQSS